MASASANFVVQILLHSKGAQAEASALGRSLDGTTGSANALSQAVNRSSSSLAGMGRTLAAWGAGAAVLDFFRRAINESREWDQATKQLSQGLRSTGGTVGYTTGQLQAMAQQLAATSRFTDDQAASGAAVLLTFTRVNREVFPETLRLSADMAQRMGTDLQSAIVMVGKAMNEPVQGITSMTRAGVQFTEQQKSQIKALVESGQLLSAQRVILAELETQFGGSAAAGQDSMNRLTKTVENLQQAFGDGLLPELDKLADRTSEIGSNGEVESRLGQIGAAVGKLIGKVSTLAGWWFKLASAPSDFLRGAFKQGLGIRNDETEAANQLAFAQAQARVDAIAAAAAERAAVAAGEQAKQEALNVAAAERIAKAKEEAAKRQERINELLSDAGTELKLHEQAWRLIRSGMPVEEVEDLLSAAQKLGAPSLLDPAVRSFAAMEQKSDAIAARIEALTLHLKRLPQTVEDLFGKGPGVDAEKMFGPDAKHRAEMGAAQQRLADETARELVMRQLINAQLQAGEISREQALVLAQELGVSLTDTFKTIEQQGATAWARYRGYAEAAADAIAGHLKGALHEAITTGSVEWEDLWDSLMNTLLSIFLDMVEQMVREWIAAQATMAAASAATGSGGGMTGGGGSWTSMLVNAGGSAALTGSTTGTATTGAMAGAGAAMGTLAIFAAVYFGVKQWIKTNKTHWDALTIHSNDSGQLTYAMVSGRGYKRALEAVGGIIQAVNEIVSGLGGQIQSLAGIEVGRTGQGSSTNWYVKYASGLVEKFGRDQEAAMEAAIIGAIQQAEISGLSPFVKEAIKQSTAKTLEQFQAELALATQLSEMETGSLGMGIRGQLLGFDAMREQITALYGASGMLAEALSLLNKSELDYWSTVRDQITGRQKTAAEEQAEAERRRNAYNAELRLRKANLDVMILEAEAALLAYQSTSRLIGGGPGGGERPGKGGGSRGGGGGGLIGMASAMLYAAGAADVATSVLTGSGDAMLDALFAQLDALKTLRGSLPDEILPGEMKPGGGRGGGSGAADRYQGVKDFLADSAFQRSLAGMTDLQRQLAELGREFDRQREAAKGNAALLAQLNAEEERRQRLLEKQAKNAATDAFRAAMGIGQDPFSQIRDGFADARKQIEEAGFGARRTARMLARLNAEEERRIELLSQQEFVAIGDGLMGLLDRYFGEVEGFEGMRIELEKVRFFLELENLRARFEILKAEGKLSAELLTMLGAAFEYIDANAGNIDWANIGRGAANDNGRGRGNDRLRDASDDAARAVEELARRFTRAKEAIGDFLVEMGLGQHGVVTSRQAYEFAQGRYRDTVARAQTGDINALEAVPEVSRDFLEALRNFSPALLAQQFPQVREQLTGLTQLTTARDGNVFVDERFQARHAEQVAVMTDGFAMVGQQGAQSVAVQQQMLVELQQLRIQNKQLNDRLALLEAERTAAKRSA